MSKGINKCTFIGNLGKDAEIRATSGGTMVANASLAVADRSKQDGAWVDVTEWVSLVCFGRTAEIMRDYTRKGSKLYVEGKLQTRSWDGKDGKKQYRTEIVVNELVLLSGKQEQAAGSPITDEDIPF
jgi:single-strand DNA-binding protein